MPEESPGLRQTVLRKSSGASLQHDNADEPVPRPSFGKRALIITAVVVLLAAMAAQLVTSREELDQIQRLSASDLLLVLLLQIFAQLAWNGAMLLPLRLHMKELAFWELFMVRAGGFLVGSVIPVAGNIGVRLAYLRGRGLAYAHFAWATLLTNAMALLSVGGVAVAAAGVLWWSYESLPPAVIGLTAGVFGLGIAAVAGFLVLPRLAAHPWLVRRASWIELGRLRATRKVFSWVLVFALARHVGNFLSFGLLYHALSSSPGTVVSGGLVYALTSPIRVVQIVPGNIGLNEWIVALVGGILSYDLTTGLLVAVVFRGMTLLAQAVAALAGSWLALRGES